MRWLLLLFPLSAWAIWIGNPAQPGLQTQGIFLQSEYGSLRCGYLNDWVYRQDLQDKFTLEGAEHEDSTIQLSTRAALLTFNFRDWVDLYGILGGSRLQVDEEVFTKSYFSWGVGGKVLFLHMGNFRAGADIKYFQTDQTPNYFISESQAYNVDRSIEPLSLAYSELQTAVGLAYETSWFSPYAQASYLIADLDPKPSNKAFVRFPQAAFGSTDVRVFASSGQKRWGMALGATILDKKMGSLAIEWRAFNQNAVDLNAEIRF